MVCDWLIRGSHDFFGEISGDFHYIFTTSKVFSRHLFTTFSLHFHYKFSLHGIFTTSFHYIFTTNFHYKGTNRQGRTDSMGTHRQIFTTFSLQIFTTKGRTDRDEQTPWGHTDRFSLHFHYIFMTILSQAANLHIFTTIFTTFSRHFHDNLITGS